MPRQTGKRTRVFIAAALLFVIVLSGSVYAITPATAANPRQRMLHQINEIRDRRGVRPVRLNARMSRKALRHSRKMIRQNRLFHTPNLSGYMARRNHNPWGENVGCGSTVRQLMRRLMNSRPHRANLLKGRYDRIGLGVSQARRHTMCGRGAFWTTQILYS